MRSRNLWAWHVGRWARGVLVVLTVVALHVSNGQALAQADESGSIQSRNIAASRSAATGAPRSEDDQAVVALWPLYRTPRGQEAFNDAMATLKATATTRPSRDALTRCPDLGCAIELPKIAPNGWIPAGRLWLAPDSYVLIVQSPREDDFSRHGRGSMSVFVFHEFHNGTRNTDLFDTISSHSGSVFVPFYLGKSGVDAEGRNYVVLVQVAPYDVISNHAANHGSAGPGVEVAKNANEPLEPLQLKAGILLAAMVVAAAPNLEVVNHRGSEGLAMLQGYESWRAEQRRIGQGARVPLPFIPAGKSEMATAQAGSIAELIYRPDMGPRPQVAMAERGILPRQLRRGSMLATLAETSGELTREPQLVGPMLPAPRPARRPE